MVDTTNGVYYEPEEDAYIYGPTSENFKAVIEFFAQAYQDGILDPDYATMTQETYWEKLSSGRTMSICDNNSFIGRVFNPALEQVDEDAYFDIVPPLENDLGQTRQYRYNKDWTDQIIVSSQVDDPVKVVQFINWFYTEEGRMVTNFGVEGQDYDMVDGNPIIKEEIVEENANASDVFSSIQGQLAWDFRAWPPMWTSTPTSRSLILSLSSRAMKLPSGPRRAPWNTLPCIPLCRKRTMTGPRLFSPI